jgi:hypothetical protein
MTTVIHCNKGQFYSPIQIHSMSYPKVGWILVAIAFAIILLAILNSYWPMLFNKYNTIKRFNQYLKDLIINNSEDCDVELNLMFGSVYNK